MMTMRYAAERARVGTGDCISSQSPVRGSARRSNKAKSCGFEEEAALHNTHAQAKQDT